MDPVPFAQGLANATKATVIAPSGLAYMQDVMKADGKFKTDENHSFFKFECDKDPEVVGVNNYIDMDDFIQK